MDQRTFTIGRALPTPSVPTTTPRSRILVIDDQPETLDEATRILQEANFDVITAVNGPEAIELFRERGDDIGLVLVNWHMEMMNGATTLQHLWQLDSTVPAILVSELSEVAMEHRFQGQGLADFIQKPYVAVDLVNRVRAAFPNR